MKVTTSTLARDGTASPLWLLDELPGVADLLWSILARVDRERDPLRIVFAAAEPRSGNTVMAAATAVALTRHLRVPVCLVETDVEHPALANYLGLRSAGLSDVLDGRASLDTCLQRVPLCPELHALPAGLPRKPIAGEFATPAMQDVLREAGERGRFLVIDAPPALGHLESRLLLQHADAALLVLRSGVTRIEAAKRAQRMLLEAGTPLLGSVFNAFGGARGRTSQAYGYARAAAERVGEHAGNRVGDPTGEPESNSLPSYELPNGAASANGLPSAPPPSGMMSEQEHLRQIDMLERRIVKLTAQLEETEAALQRIAKMKGIDLGIASIYRSVQGLSDEEDALALKQELMQKIFEANYDLKQSMQRRASANGTRLAQ